MKERPTTNDPPKALALKLDVEKYLGQLKDWDVSEKQKSEFIAALWRLLLSFAELGFEIHPAQYVQKDISNSARKRLKDYPEKTSKTQEKPGVSAEKMLYSNHSNTTHNDEIFKTESSAKEGV